MNRPGFLQLFITAKEGTQPRGWVMCAQRHHINLQYHIKGKYRSIILEKKETNQTGSEHLVYQRGPWGPQLCSCSWTGARNNCTPSGS